MPKTTTSKRNHDLGCFATQNDGLPETFYGNDSVTFHYIFFKNTSLLNVLFSNLVFNNLSLNDNQVSILLENNAAPF